MSETCSSCLNAYNRVDHKVCCVNREFDKQFDKSVDSRVSRSFSCSRYQKRRSSQARLVFDYVEQLNLFDDYE